MDIYLKTFIKPFYNQMKNCIEGNEITTVLDALDLKLEGVAPFITDSQNTNFTTYVQK